MCSLHHSGELISLQLCNKKQCGYLDGHAIVPQQAQTLKSALYTSTFLMIFTLWHRRAPISTLLT